MNYLNHMNHVLGRIAMNINNDCSNALGAARLDIDPASTTSNTKDLTLREPQDPSVNVATKDMPIPGTANGKFINVQLQYLAKTSSNATETQLGDLYQTQIILTIDPDSTLQGPLADRQIIKTLPLSVFVDKTSALNDKSIVSCFGALSPDAMAREACINTNGTYDSATTPKCKYTVLDINYGTATSTFTDPSLNVNGSIHAQTMNITPGTPATAEDGMIWVP